MEPKVLIIGAGISGLSAGIYARMNGFETHIFEKSSHAGGVCQSWNRNGYQVNGSIHWLMGSGPGTDYYKMWRELGVIENSSFYHHLSFMEYELEDGRQIHLYTDVYKLRKELLDWAYEDAESIHSLCDSILAIANHPLPFPEIGRMNQVLSFAKTVFTEMPLIFSMVKWQPITVGEFASGLANPHLRSLFEHLWHPEMSMSFLLVQFAFAHMGSAGYPLGGSGRFIEKLQKRYESLSGHLHFEAPVKRILMENKKANGILLENGIEVEGDFVVSAADGHKTLFEMIGEKWLDESHKEAFQTLKTFPGLFYFSAGINRTFSEIPPSISGISLRLKKSVNVGLETQKRVTFQVYNFDPTLASPGHTLITALIPTSYSYWKNLHEKGMDEYRFVRQQIVDELLANLNFRFPGLKDQVEFSDAATPMTYEIETGNYRGSYEGWLPTPNSLRKSIPQTLKGLDNFFLSGHWVSAGGGMPPAAFTGRNAIALICKQMNREFNCFTT